MIVNFYRKVCFLLHPKTASRTTSKALQANSGFVQVTDHHSCWRDELYSDRRLEERGLDPENVHRWRGEDLRHYAYVYVIRNPFDTLASWYEDMAHVRGQELGRKWYKKFLRHHPKLFPPNGLWPYLHDTPPGPTLILRYENLETELECLAELFRFPKPGTLEVIGETLTRAEDYREYYTPEARAWVEHTFAKDLEAGGYTFE